MKIYIFSLLIFILLILMLYWNHYLLKKSHSVRSKIAEIFLEDVINRIEDVDKDIDTHTGYRKIREAHASLESLSGIVGGYDKLSTIVKTDVLKIDEILEKKKMFIER